MPPSGAGTEEGAIHLCSTSYAEQYSASFAGHLGPVYAVAWSPFKPGLFLSASADWTLRLWSEGEARRHITARFLSACAMQTLGMCNANSWALSDDTYLLTRYHQLAPSIPHTTSSRPD